MDPFTHLSILLSIILGLGIAELLTRFGGIIERRHSARLYGPSLAWALVLLLAHVQTWWSIFGLREYRAWTFLTFSTVLLQPIMLFLLSVLALPRGGDAVDLRVNYYAHRRWFFGLFGGLLIVSVTKDLVLSGQLPSATNLEFHAVLFAVSLTGFLTAREGVHRVLAVLSVSVLVAYIAVLFSRLP